MSEDKLVMTFEANTIQHLGIKMYSTMPPALAELIANAYDACSKEVLVKLYDTKEKKVIVQDFGNGMSFAEVNDHFLRIGRNRRLENQVSGCGRIPTGKKGLGKLALFGIGEVIEIITSNGEEGVRFVLDWNQILNWKGGDYTPIYKKIPKEQCVKGTTITLTQLNRVTGFPVQEYAISIAKLFNFSDSFIVRLSLNNGKPIIIDSKLKYQNIQPEFSWDIKDVIAINTDAYSEKSEIRGQVVTTKKPLNANQRGITLFANGRMVNTAEFFGPSESSHFFSYATGWLDIDFIDNWQVDVISTNRQSIDWENEATIPLRRYLASCISIIERDWRKKRKKKKQDRITEKTNIDIAGWLNTLPIGVKEQIEGIVNLWDDTPELSEETQQRSIAIVHRLVPEYPNLHWRYLHDEIKSSSESDYINRDYYRAFIEAVKRYINQVRAKSGSTVATDSSMMGAVYGFDKILRVAAMYNKPDGTRFHEDTYKCIEEGQKMLSMGIVSGARNPISHEEIVDLRDSNLFNEKDCLDMLSLLSHLFRRLDDIVEHLPS